MMRPVLQQGHSVPSSQNTTFYTMREGWKRDVTTIVVMAWQDICRATISRNLLSSLRIWRARIRTTICQLKTLMLTIYSRAINGILAMNEFKEKFGTCRNQPDRDDICAKDSALIVAILSVGTAIGALLAAPAGDMLGRRRSMLLAVGIFCIGAICQVCAEALPALLVGRWVFCFPSPTSPSPPKLGSVLGLAGCFKLCNVTD